MIDTPHRLEATDGELLFRFLEHHSEGAFRELVERHAKLVTGVCRRVLWHEQDVEDAFQATFLVLARRGRTVRSRDSLASWLFQVARRICLRAADRRRSAPKSTGIVAPDGGTAAPASTSPTPLETIQSREEFEILATELERLPERYRLPLVLCYFEGQSRAAAAEQLDCTESAVKSRLARGRRLLRHRLMRRGVALSVAFGAFVASGPASAGWTANATAAAIHESTGGAAGTAASPASLTLSQGATTMVGLPAVKGSTILATSLAASLLVAAGVALSDPPDNAGRATAIDSRAGGTANEGSRAVRVAPRTETPRVAETAEATAGAETSTDPAPPPTNRDEEFVRRVYLDHVGRLPTKEELRAALAIRGAAFADANDDQADRLDATVEIDVGDGKLGTALDAIRKQTGLNLVLDWTSFSRAGWVRGHVSDLPTDVELSGVSARSALKLLLEPHGLEAQPRGEIVTITFTPAQARVVRIEKSPGDLRARGPSELRIERSLDEQTEVEFVDVPLAEGLDFLADLHDVTILIDEASLKEIGVTTDAPLNMVLSGVTMRSALNLLLDPLELTWVTENEVMRVISRADAEKRRDTRVYPIGPLLEAGVVEADSATELLLPDAETPGVKALRVGDFVTITQSPIGHRRTAEILDQLRRAAIQEAGAAGVATSGIPRISATPAPANVTGVVVETMTVDGSECVEISIGADDGIRKGERLDVQSADGSQHLGRIDIVYVTPDRAIGRIVEKRAGTSPKKGDRVVK